MANKEQIDNVVAYLSYLQDSMKEAVRRREYKVGSFSFTKLASDVEEIWRIANDDSKNEIERLEELSTSNSNTKNAINVYDNVASINNIVKGYVSKRFWMKPISMLEPSEPNRAKDPCAYPDIVERTYPLLKGRSSESDMPISWEQFINDYVLSPKPYYHKLQNDFTEKSLKEKLQLTVSEYAEQKRMFEKITNPEDMEQSQYKRTWDWYQDNKGSYFASGKDWYSPDNLEKVKKKLLNSENTVQKYRNLYNLVIDKICLNSLLRKSMECTLPPLECASLIKLLGAQNVLSFLANIKSIDSRVQTVEQQFKELPEEQQTEDKFIEIVTGVYEDDLEYLCQILMYTLFSTLGIKVPDIFDLLPRGDTTITDPFQGYLETLTSTITNISVDFSISLVISLIELLEDCDRIDDLLKNGDLSGTPFENLAEDAKSTISNSFKKLGTDLGTFLINLRARIDDNAIGGNVVISPNNPTGISTGVGNLFGQPQGEQLREQETQFDKVGKVISSDTFFSQIMDSIGLSKLLRLLSGDATEETLSLLRQEYFSDIDINNDYLLEVFSIIGIFYGLDNLKDEFLAAATELEQDGVSFSPSTNCAITLEEADNEKMLQVRSIVDSLTSPGFMDGLINSDGVANVLNTIEVPQVVSDSIRIAVKGSILPIKMSYDNDMSLYKMAASEEVFSTRKVPKILWAESTVRSNTIEEGKIVSKSGVLPDTIINPEFEAMVQNGFVPLKADGTPDGTKFGAVMGLKWWPPWEEGWMTKTERISLGRDENGDPKSEDVNINDLPGALGPYTDYETDANGGSPYALKRERQVRQASGVRESLGMVPPRGSIIGESVDLDSSSALGESLFENYFNGRGERRVYDAETIERLDELYAELSVLREKLETAEGIKENNSTPPPLVYPEITDRTFLTRPVNPLEDFVVFYYHKTVTGEIRSSNRDDYIRQAANGPSLSLRKKFIATLVEAYPDDYYRWHKGKYENTSNSKTKSAALKEIKDGWFNGGTISNSILEAFTEVQKSTYEHLLEYETITINRGDGYTVPFQQESLSPQESADYDPSEDTGTSSIVTTPAMIDPFSLLPSTITQINWPLVFSREDYDAARTAAIVENNNERDEWDLINEDIDAYILDRQNEISDKEGEISVIRDGSNTLDIFENYDSKTYYGFSGLTNRTVISENENVQKFLGEDTRVVETSPSYRISMANEYGTVLDNHTYFYIYRDGKNPTRMTVKKQNNYEPSVVEDLVPDFESNPCDSPGFDTSGSPTSQYTSQENLFFHLINGLYDFADSSQEYEKLKDTLLKEEGNDYDDIYKNIFHIFLNKMRNSSLLKEVDVTSVFGDIGEQSSESSYSGEKPIGMSFVNFNPTDSKNYELISRDPRIMDFDNIVENVIENYNNFSANNIGEENPDGKQKYDTPLQLALRTAHPSLVARIYLLEHMMQSLVPTLSMGIEMNDMLEKIIVDRVQIDMAKRTPYLVRFKENTINVFQTLEQLGEIPSSTSPITFRRAFRYFLDKEFPIVLGNLRKIVFKEQVSCENKNSSAENLPPSEQDLEQKMKKQFLDSIPVAFISGFSPGGMTIASDQPANTTGERYYNTESTAETLYRQVDEILETSDSQGSLILQINAEPLTGFLGDYSKLAKYINGEAGVLDPELQAVQELGLSMSEDEFVNEYFGNSGVTMRLMYVRRSNTDNHMINQGTTKKRILIDKSYDSSLSENLEANVPDKFFYFKTSSTSSPRYRCYTLAESTDDLKGLLGRSISEFKDECTERLEQEYDVAEKSVYDMLEQLVYRKLLDQMMGTNRFGVMFDYCFNLSDISTIANSHISQSNMTEDMVRMFSSTKEKIRLYLNSLDEYGTDMTKDVTDCLPVVANEPGIGNFNADMDFSSELLLMILSTPLYIYKGWVKVADPHCLITQTIVDLAETGYLNPKFKPVKIQVPFADPPDDCITRDLPFFPGDPIDMPGLTQLVALGVTFAPCIVGSPPFPPTPFGLIYYTVVEPLLYLLEQDWRNKNMMQNPDYKNAIEVQTGLDMGDVPVCEEDLQLLEEARQQEQEIIDEASDRLDEEGPCPALDIEFRKGDDC